MKIETELWGKIALILFLIPLVWFVIAWVWHGLHIIIGSKDKPMVEFWTCGIKRFFKKNK